MALLGMVKGKNRSALSNVLMQMKFRGDEDMTRAISALDDLAKTEWNLDDVTMKTRATIRDAFRVPIDPTPVIKRTTYQPVPADVMET